MGSTRKKKKEDASLDSQWTPEQKFSIIMEYCNDRVCLYRICAVNTGSLHPENS